MSISFGESFITLYFCAIRLISTASVSRLSGDKSFESLTPSSLSFGKSSSFIRTPAIVNGPITEPRPASSTPAINMERSLTRGYLGFKAITLYSFRRCEFLRVRAVNMLPIYRLNFVLKFL